MQIVMLAGDFPPSVGGIQQYVAGVADALVELGHDVHVVAVAQDGDGEFDAAARYPVTRVPGGGKRTVWAQMQAVAAKILSGPSSAIIATKWFPEGPAALAAAKATGAFGAVICHDREFALHGLNLVKWGLQKHVLGTARICFALTGYVVDELRGMGVPTAKIRKAGAGVAVDKFRPNPERAAEIRAELRLGTGPVITTVARLAKHKGHRHVMEAMGEVLEVVPDLKYVIVGGGEYQRELESFAYDYDVKDHVIFAGRVPDSDLPAYYTMSSVAVMPSFDIKGWPTEGFGLSFLEANACGIPVIGARTGGIPEAIADGVSGLIVPPADPAALAEAMKRLLTDVDYAQQLGRQGRQRVLDEFTWRHVASRIANELGG